MRREDSITCQPPSLFLSPHLCSPDTIPATLLKLLLFPRVLRPESLSSATSPSLLLLLFRKLPNCCEPHCSPIPASSCDGDSKSVTTIRSLRGPNCSTHPANYLLHCLELKLSSSFHSSSSTAATSNEPPARTQQYKLVSLLLSVSLNAQFTVLSFEPNISDCFSRRASFVFFTTFEIDANRSALQTSGFSLIMIQSCSPTFTFIRWRPHTKSANLLLLDHPSTLLSSHLHHICHQHVE